MRQSLKTFMPIILLVACLAQAASDLYLPSVPSISKAFHVPITLVQLTIPIYLFGLSISQLFYGPLSEGIGRRIPLMMGLIIMIVGSLICVAAPNIYVLIVGRLIQGIGAGAGAALFRSIFRDMFEGVELAKFGSFIAIFITLVIPAMPMIGGYLETYFGWRSAFVTLTLYTAVTLIAVFSGLKETSKLHHSERLKPTFIIASYKELLTSRTFLGYTICTFLAYGGFFAWFTVAPVLMIIKLHVSPVEFGWITLASSVIAMSLGGWVNGRLVMKYGTRTMLTSGLCIMLTAGILMFLGELLIGMNVLTLILPVLLFHFGTTFIWPNAFAGAFSPFGHIAGYSGALYGCMQIGGGAVVGAIAAHIPTGSQLPLACVFISVSILGLLWFRFTVR